MIAIEPELQALKKNLLDMIHLVIDQLDKCNQALQKRDEDIANQVIEQEQTVDALELTIDRECENILALYTPVASDLRFVISTLRISNDLERIGDNANGLAKFIKDNLEDLNKQFVTDLGLQQVLEILVSMLMDMAEAFKDGETKLAKESIKKDLQINEIKKKALHTSEELIRTNPDQIKTLLKLFSIIANLERAGDLTKNIGEEIVFHIEAEVLKHKKAQAKDPE
jgi:phosphate transport system protein